MKSEIVTADFKKLNGFLKSLTAAKGWAVDVGVFGHIKERHDKSGKTNAEIGFVHEFGSSKIPKRSFLRMPLFQKQDRIVKEAVSDMTVKNLVKTDWPAVLVDFGIACERAILDAFDSAGFGSWARNKPSTIKRKGSSQPLIDLGFLRRSIASQVVKL